MKTASANPAPTARPQHGRGLVVLLAALSMLGALCIDAYLPSLPSIAREFGVSAAAAQQTLTIYLVGFALMSLFYGTLSDSFGRRRVLLGSMWLYLAGAAGAVFARDLATLMFFRAIQGLSAGAGSVIGRAIVTDLMRGAEAQRVMAAISVVFGLAPAIAPIVGGQLQAAFGWRSVFIFIVAFVVVLLAACLRWLPESLPQAERHPFRLTPILANYWNIVTHARFLSKSLGIAFAFFGLMIYVGGAPSFVMGVLHLPVTAFAWLFIPLIGGMTIGSATAARLSHRLSAQATIRLSYSIMALGVAANVLYEGLSAHPTVPWAVLPIFVYSFGLMLSVPAMTVITLDLFPHHRGLASSMQGFTFMAIFAACSGIVCPLLAGSGLRLALGTAAGAALSFAAWSFGARVQGKPSHRAEPPVPLPVP